MHVSTTSVNIQTVLVSEDIKHFTLKLNNEQCCSQQLFCVKVCERWMAGRRHSSTLTVQVSVQGQQMRLVQAAERWIVDVLWQRRRHPGQGSALGEAALRRLLFVSCTAVLKPNLGNFSLQWATGSKWGRNDSVNFDFLHRDAQVKTR